MIRPHFQAARLRIMRIVSDRYGRQPYHTLDKMSLLELRTRAARDDGDSAALVDMDKSGRGLERIFEKDHTTRAGAPLSPSSAILPKPMILN